MTRTNGLFFMAAAAAALTAADCVETQTVGELFKDCDVCPGMTVVPAGSFEMGPPENEKERHGSEGPRRRVRIGKAFAVGVYEVTFAEWNACAAAGGCGGYRLHDEGRGRRPVTNVSWDDAQSYVSWLRQKTEKSYRLLSEAEWEYAARAGTTTRYSFGDDLSLGEANYGFTAATAQPVGSYAPNDFGLYDMHGNVWEWVQDCWNDSYDGAPIDGSAWEKGICSERVVRGGSWLSHPRSLRSANRTRYDAGSRNYGSLGFRVARTLTP